MVQELFYFYKTLRGKICKKRLKENCVRRRANFLVKGQSLSMIPLLRPMLINLTLNNLQVFVDKVQKNWGKGV
ncbi:hypothetical protein ACFPUW_16500 [Thalassorhabdus alkalitolerans]